MNAQFTYKTKKLLLIVVLILFTILGYKRIIANSARQITNYFNEKSLIIDEKELDAKIVDLKIKVEQIDKILGKVNFNEHFIQYEILDYVTANTGKFDIEVVKLLPTHIFNENGYLIVSNEVVLKGEYNDLIRAIYQIEKEIKISKISGVKFFKKKNHRTNRMELFSRLIFQNFKKH